MRRLLFILVVLLALGAACAATGTKTSGTTSGATTDGPRNAFDQVVIKPADGVGEAALDAALDALGAGDATLEASTLNWWLASFPPIDPVRDAAAGAVLVSKVAALPQVAVAEANAKRSTRR